MSIINSDGLNTNWQLKMLLGQQCTCDELAAINANTDQVEYLLSASLNSLQDSNDYEAKFVVDTCDSNKVYLEVRIWDPTPSPGTWGPVTYYLPGSSTPVTPAGAGTPGCLIYTDPTGILGMIYSFLQTNFDVKLSTRAAASQLPSTLGQTNMAGSLSVTLANNQLGIARTTGMLRPTGSGNVSSAAATFFSVSVANVGSANGTVLAGVTIKPGEVLNFSADAVNNYFTDFAYDATGTEFIIIFVS